MVELIPCVVVSTESCSGSIVDTEEAKFPLLTHSSENEEVLGQDRLAKRHWLQYRRSGNRTLGSSA